MNTIRSIVRQNSSVPVMASSFLLRQSGEADAAMDLDNAISEMDAGDFDDDLFSSIQWIGSNQSEHTKDFLFLLRAHLSMREECFSEDESAWVRLIAMPVAGTRPNVNALARMLHDRPETAPVSAFGGQAKVTWMAVPFLPEEVVEWTGRERQDLLENGLSAFCQGASVQAVLDTWATPRPSTEVASAAPEGSVIPWTSALLVGMVTSNSMELNEAGEAGQISGWPWMSDYDIWLGEDSDDDRLDSEPQEKTDRRDRRTQEHIEKRMDDSNAMKQAAAAAGIPVCVGFPGDLLDVLTQRVGLHVSAAMALEEAMDDRTGKTAARMGGARPARIHVAQSEENNEAGNCLWVAVETANGRVFGPYAIHAFETLDVEEMVEATLEWLGLPQELEKHAVFHENRAQFPGRHQNGQKLRLN